MLEEKWNEAAKALIEVGDKLWAVRRLIDRDPIALSHLNIPELGETNGRWSWNDLSDSSYQHSFEDVLAM